jgi:hypothetical protein
MASPQLNLSRNRSTEDEMADWTKEEKLAAAEKIATIRYGVEHTKTWRDSQVQAVLKAFSWDADPNMHIHVSFALDLQCEVTALREMLNHLVRYMEDADNDLLIVEDARALLDRIPK